MEDASRLSNPHFVATKSDHLMSRRPGWSTWRPAALRSRDGRLLSPITLAPAHLEIVSGAATLSRGEGLARSPKSIRSTYDKVRRSLIRCNDPRCGSCLRSKRVANIEPVESGACCCFLCIWRLIHDRAHDGRVSNGSKRVLDRDRWRRQRRELDRRNVWRKHKPELISGKPHRRPGRSSFGASVADRADQPRSRRGGVHQLEPGLKADLRQRSSPQAWKYSRLF